MPNQRIAFPPSASPLEQGSYRALAATANHFARELHMDEVARGLGADPVELRLVTAFECGAIVNPDGVRNQVEGCVVQGLGGALFEAIELEAGRILNASLASYRMPRFTDVPALEVVLLDRPDLPSAGASETPIAAVAPAIASAARRFGPVAPDLPIRFDA